MLRKRSRSRQKDQHKMSDELYFQSEVFGQKQRTNSFFNVPGLFVGFSPKNEIDAVRSPTSPLDFRVFSNLGNPFKSPKSPRENKNWGSDKVGLGIVESLDEETKSGSVSQCLDTKNIVLGSQIRTKPLNARTRFESFDKPNSLPKNYASSAYPRPGQSNTLFGNQENQETRSFHKILSCSLDSRSGGSHLTSKSRNFPNFTIAKQTQIPESVDVDNHGLIDSFSASEIELSEDYTCVRTHGPNPKTTHIYGDCILECHRNKFIANTPKNKGSRVRSSSKTQISYPSNSFLSFCHACKKCLDGEDIYMYRGQKAFCSTFCRSEEILIDEAKKKARAKSLENSKEEISEKGVFFFI